MQKLIYQPSIARRLALGIASDIALMHEDKVKQGIRQDNLFELLRPEIDEGRKLYAMRVSETIVQGRSFFEHALVDVIFKAKGELIDSPIW